MRRSFCGRWSPLLIWVLTLTALVAPVADVIAFGLHDHVSVSARAQGGLTLTGADTAPSHHCELAMSPGVLLQTDELPAPGPIASPPGAPRLMLASHTPIVPFNPPRA